MLLRGRWHEAAFGVRNRGGICRIKQMEDQCIYINNCFVQCFNTVRGLFRFSQGSGGAQPRWLSLRVRHMTVEGPVLGIAGKARTADDADD